MRLTGAPLTVWGWLRDTAKDFIADGAPAQAASIAFYALLSLAPLLVVVIAIAGAVWGPEAARGEIVAQFGGLMGDDAAKTIEGIIQRASEQPRRGTLATIVGVGILLSGAIGVFGQIKSALNAIWEVEPRPGRGVWGFLRDRILSFAMVACIAFLLLVSLALSATLSAAGDWIGSRVQLPPAAMWTINMLLSVGIITLLFAAMYKVLPDVRIAWRDVWIGAVTTAVLFNVGKYLIGLYLGRTTTVSVYGAAGSLVLILLWVYYSSIIFLLGAEFTQVYARWCGSEIQPSASAMWRTDACKTDPSKRAAKRRGGSDTTLRALKQRQ